MKGNTASIPYWASPNLLFSVIAIELHVSMEYERTDAQRQNESEERLGVQSTPHNSSNVSLFESRFRDSRLWCRKSLFEASLVPKEPVPLPPALPGKLVLCKTQTRSPALHRQPLVTEA